MIPLTDSKFNMWRACVAAVHLDNIVSTQERKWVEDRIQTLPCTSEQKLILKDDLQGGEGSS